MTQSYWTYTGILDFFDVEEDIKINFLNNLQEELYQAGGEAQVQEVDNLLDTDRYKISCKITSLNRPLIKYLSDLTKYLPEDHYKMIIEGYNHYNLEREDLIINKKSLYIKKYIFSELETIQYQEVE